MTDPKIDVPTIDPTNYVSEAFGDFRRIVQNAFGDGYRQGYARAEEDAIAKIINAVRPNANGQAAEDEADESETPDSTAFVDAFVREAGTRGATPIEIFQSESNKRQLSRSRIGKILRRGEDRGHYRNDGTGRYFAAGGHR